MRNKIFIIFTLLLIFLGCNKKQYKHMYDNKLNVLDYPIKTQGQNDHNTIQNGQNPMKRPSYDEYRQR